MMDYIEREDEKYLMNMIKALVKEKPEAILKCKDFDDFIQTITNVIPYGDITELCERMGVDEYWFWENFAWDEVIEDYYFLSDGDAVIRYK